MPCFLEETTSECEAIKFHCPMIRGFDDKFFLMGELFMLYSFVMLCVMAAQKKNELVSQDKLMNSARSSIV
jgi:hypothetical protein